MFFADYIKQRLPYWPNFITEILLKLNNFGGLCYGRAYMNYPKHISSSNPEEKLVSMANFAIKSVPYYRNRYGNLKIRTRKEFEEKIGFIDKNVVMSHWNDFIADGVDRSKCYVESTGGTSGKPMKFLSPQNRYIHEMYFWHALMKQSGWNYDTVGVIRNNKLSAKRIYMVNPVMKQIIFDGFRTDDEYYRNIWNVIKRKNIRYLHCYPTSAYNFLRFCYKNGLNTSFIKACFLSSEAVTEAHWELINNKLHIKVLSTYGHSEKLCHAGTHLDDMHLYIDEQYGLTELIDKNGKVIDKKDEFGEIVGTTFINPYFPLIRYRTGDYSSFAEEPTKCENGRVLNPIEGRRNKSQIFKSNGSTISITALNLHSKFNDKVQGIQYIQEQKGYLKALVVKDAGYGEEDHLFLRNHLSQAMGGDEYISIEYVNKLIYQPNGKFLPLISKCLDV